jgi:VWFA-related protein
LAPGQTSREAAFRTPLVEREEVRFVVLDVFAEERVPGGWRPARGLSRESFRIKLDRREVPVDHFESGCDPQGEPPRPAVGTDAASASADGAAAAPPRVGADSPSPQAPPPAPVRHVLYLDESHLTFAGRIRSLRAAREWAPTSAHPDDLVMIVLGGMSLRIVRPFLPASRGLVEDLAALMGGFGRTDHYADQEESRIDDVLVTARMAGPWAAAGRADGYAEEAFLKARRSLEILRDLMAIFDRIEGPKNLVLFVDSLRQYPGRVYPNASHPQPVNAWLHAAAGAANERDVRTYAVHAAGLGIGERADDALTALASETGGRWVEGTNRLGVVFDRVAEDAACFYRVGFHARPAYRGAVSRIEVLVDGPARAYRLRHRRTLEDPTREGMETSVLRAAFLDPASARDLPVTVTAAPLLEHLGGARVRLEVGVPVGELLALPDPGMEPGERRTHLQMGGRVVPLLEGAAPGSADRGAWADADPSRASVGFAGQALLTLPPQGPDAALPRAAVRTAEIEAPPGHYRIVAVVQDRRSGLVGAGLGDLRVRPGPGGIGPIGVAVEDPRVVAVGGPAEEDWTARRGRRGSGEPALARPLLPERAVVLEEPVLPAGRAAVFYGVCEEALAAAPADGAPGRRRFEGWTVARTLRCGAGGDDVVLLEREVPDPEGAGSCVLMIDTIEARRLRAGMCRFEVTLRRPGLPEARRAAEVTVDGPDAG